MVGAKHSRRADPNREDYGHEALHVPAAWPPKLYPTQPAVQLELAESLADTGDPASARAAAQRALRLDDALPAEDKRLSPAQRDRAEQLTLPAKTSRAEAQRR